MSIDKEIHYNRKKDDYFDVNSTILSDSTLITNTKVLRTLNMRPSKIMFGAIIFCILLTSNFVIAQANSFVIDSFQYASSDDAQAEWTEFLAGEDVTQTGTQTLSLYNDFTASTLRGIWDRYVNLDLSTASEVSLKLKSTRSSMYLSLYFFTSAGGLYVKHFYITDKWENYVFPLDSFGTEGTVNGWNNITRIRLSCWQQNDPSPATVYVEDMRADDRVLDSFLYTTEAEAAVWQPLLAASPATPVTGLALGNAFTSSTVRGYWDRYINLDISAYSVIAIRLKSPRSTMLFTLYFFTSAGGYYSKSFKITDKWKTYVFPLQSFKTDGTVNGWNNITRIRLSCWQQESSTPATVAVADLQASNYSNLIPNSSFDVTTMEAMPDHWGFGSWGLNQDAWVLDTNSWRAKWGVDKTTANNSFRIVNPFSEAEANAELRLMANQLPVPLVNCTFSVWLKSDTASQKIRLRAFEKLADPSISHDNEITTSPIPNTWERYSLTFTPQTPTAGQCWISLIVQALDSGTLWVDKVQVEAGNLPTQWHSSLCDRDIEHHALHRAKPSVEDCTITPDGDNTSVSIDSNGIFCIDGDPFVPLGNFWPSVYLPSSDIVEQMGKAGFNSIMIPVYEKTNTISNAFSMYSTFLDAAQANGMKVVIWLDKGLSRTSFETWINDLKYHPAIIVWYIYDEPTSNDVTEVNTRYAIAKAADSTRPAMVNLSSTFPSISSWDADILSADRYPVGADSENRGACDFSDNTGFTLYADIVKKLVTQATTDQIPAWFFIQSMGYAHYVSRAPTSAETESIVYLTLINGSRGLFYFCSKPASSEQWNAIRALNYEVNTLAPVLLSTDTAPAVSVNSPSIHLLCKRYQGETYVIAVNDSPLPVTAELTISEADAWVMFEDRLVLNSNGKLTDTFGGYQRHVYHLNDTKLHLALDESAGASIATDYSGNGNNGTLVNMTGQDEWVSGIIGNALDFDGLDDYVDCGNAPSLQLTGDLTLSLWIKPNNFNHRQNPLNKNLRGEFSLTVETNGALSYYHSKDVSPYYWGPTVFPSGTLQEGIWQHIVITRNATTRVVKAYYGGVLINTFIYPTDALPNVSVNPVMIGNGYAGAFDGQIDDVRIYSRTFSQDEIEKLANP